MPRGNGAANPPGVTAMRYASGYSESSGQPDNGVEYHTSKREAIARAKTLRGSIFSRSGGSAWACKCDEHGRPDSWQSLYKWVEGAEGGYRAN